VREREREREVKTMNNVGFLDDYQVSLSSIFND
jgi:hypothetical protein